MLQHSILDAEVSFFDNYFTSKTDVCVYLRDWLTSTAYRKEILLLRKELNKARRNKIKSTLPAITISGIFRPTRSAKHLVQHSGLIGIDIDQQDNPHIPKIAKMKCVISELPEIAYCGLSASGNGLFAIIPISKPEKHREYFDALLSYFHKTFGINIDKACKDVCRLRGISYDSAGYINHKAATFATLPINENYRPISRSNTHTNSTVVNKILRVIMSTQTDITATREDWFQICSVLVNNFDEEGRQIFHAFSQFHPKYNTVECDKLFDDLLRREPYDYTIGTLVHIARNYEIIT